MGMDGVSAFSLLQAGQERMHMRDVAVVDFLVRTDFFFEFTAHFTLHSFRERPCAAQPKIHCTAKPSNSGRPRNCSNTPYRITQAKAAAPSATYHFSLPEK